ncbi:spore germination protein GerW family protein [Streptomyces sp. NPDC005485]|uniref:spore germination protein GerW family protein n=1 Tax=Streptomyces sp. NPDC005485 TaxID=3155591 RepID=UPI0033A09734
MTAPQDTSPSSADPTDPAVGTPALDAAVAATAATDGIAARLLEGLAERFGGRASVAAVFGEPVTREGVTVIPVARAAFGFGGGTARGVRRFASGEGGGGGGGCETRPLGFIELRDGSATYHRIRDPWTDVVAPLATLLLGTTAPLLARALTARRGRSH